MYKILKEQLKNIFLEMEHMLNYSLLTIDTK